MTELVLSSVGAVQGSMAIVENASVTIRPGTLSCLLGPNGAGKTTLLRLAAGVSAPTAGHVMVDGDDIGVLSPQARARKLAYLPQTRPLAWPLRVRDVVSLGRFAYGARIATLRGPDAEAVSRAVSACRLEALEHRRTDTLSGGELARVHLARALATEAPLLLADEPVQALDPRHQHDIMAVIRASVDAGQGALVVLHDVDLAARFADRLLFMKDGRLDTEGAPADILTADHLERIYGVRATINGTRVQIEGPT